MKLTHSIAHGQVTLTFDGKPSERIRSILKANRFRWSPVNRYWWRQSSTGTADLIGAIRKILDKEAGIRRIDGKCWKCKDPEGYLRNHGASAPVLCDDCEEESVKLQHTMLFGKGGVA